MSTAPHVFKGGAVYWWRRRLPDGTDSRAFVQTEISLSTKELNQAGRSVIAEVYPDLALGEKVVAGVEGWILGVPGFAGRV